MLVVLAALAGCAAPMPDRAAKIQVHSQMSTLLSGCKNLGPVSASAGNWAMGGAEAVAEAKTKARLMTADLGGDTMVVLNTDGDGTALTLQATALRCY
jgi:hypothetical protein